MKDENLSMEAQTRRLIESGNYDADEAWFEATVRLEGGDERKVLFRYEAPYVTGEFSKDQVSTSRAASKGRMRALKNELKGLYKVKLIEKIRHCATGETVYELKAA